jgi:hypothetical protein
MCSGSGSSYRSAEAPNKKAEREGANTPDTLHNLQVYEGDSMAETEGKAPTAIPQDIQQQIIELAVVKARMDAFTSSYERRRERLAATMIASAE